MRDGGSDSPAETHLREACRINYEISAQSVIALAAAGGEILCSFKGENAAIPATANEVEVTTLPSADPMPARSMH